jgi:hypothetical protein
MRGKIHPPRTALIRVHVGDATDECGNKFQMSTLPAQGTPCIYSERTGKYYTLSWQDILDLAIESGILVLDQPTQAIQPTAAKEAA